MAPLGEGMGNGGSCTSTTSTQQRSMISNNVHRTTSDISFQISKEALVMRSSVVVDDDDDDGDDEKLQNNRRTSRKLLLVGPPDPISEVVVAKCECCGMSEECTPEYIERVRSKFMGKWVCGLCAEAVKEEKEKLKAVVVSMEEALNIHINACSRFNKLGRAYPVLFQAQAMREMLKKTSAGCSTLRAAKSFNHTDPHNNRPIPIARSSSCIPAITNINPSSSSN